jgi:hypothetical protein
VRPTHEDEAFEQFRNLGADEVPAFTDEIERRIRAKYEAGRNGLESSAVERGAETVLQLERAHPPTRPRPRRFLVVAAVVLGLAVGLTVLIARSGERGEVSTGLDDTAIGDLARGIALEPDAPLAAGEYLHSPQRTGSRLTLPDGSVWLIDHRDIWQNSRGEGLMRTEEEIIPIDGAEVDLKPSVGEVVLPAGAMHGTLSYDELRGLPTDAGQLLDQLRSRAASEEEVIEQLARILNLPVITPAVRAAALNVFELLGAQDIGPTQDYTGRVGRGFAGHTAEGSWLLVLTSDGSRPIGVALGLDSTAEPSFASARRWVEFDPPRRVAELPA